MDSTNPDPTPDDPIEPRPPRDGRDPRGPRPPRDPSAGRRNDPATADRARIFEAPTIRCFDAPAGSMHVLEAAVDQANMDARRLEHLLLVGPAGSGKQVLARAVVRELAQQAVEVDGESVENLPHLLAIIRPLRNRDVLVVRHVDQMAPRGQQHLAVIVGERRVPRVTRTALERQEWLGLAEPEPPAVIPEFSLLATAADPAKVQPMLARHVELTVRLAAPSPACQRSAIRRALAGFQLSADEAAALRLVELATAHPDCTEPIVRVVAIRARAEGRSVIARDLVDACAAEDLPLFLPTAAA
jgi:Holliday junction resolvasome RuvABC ATP-dependent DNA helicase subunit